MKVQHKGQTNGKNGKKINRTNQELAGYLDEIGELLEAQNANPFRVRAYRLGAETLRQLRRPAHTILADEGPTGLQKLPNIGVSLARAIEQLDQTGKLGLLDRLRGEIRPEDIFATVPGIGDKLAGLIHEQLGIESLAELQTAAYDGRLDQVPGFGQRRLRAVRESLAGRFAYRHRLRARPPAQPPVDQPSVAELLAVDQEYRRKAQADQLPKIAPRRFNPTGQPWLPILHTERGATHYTALYSNTARAHELNMTHDWVVIYRDDHGGSGQWTVVTAHFGPMRGRRIVRGREAECSRYYHQQPVAA